VDVSQAGRELPEEEREPFWLPAGSAVRVLEVGCGTADDVGTLLATGRVAEYIGVDLDELAVVRARAQWPRATFLCADAAQLPRPIIAASTSCSSADQTCWPSLPAGVRSLPRCQRTWGMAGGWW